MHLVTGEPATAALVVHNVTHVRLFPFKNLNSGKDQLLWPLKSQNLHLNALVFVLNILDKFIFCQVAPVHVVGVFKNDSWLADEGRYGPSLMQI